MLWILTVGRLVCAVGRIFWLFVRRLAGWILLVALLGSVLFITGWLIAGLTLLLVAGLLFAGFAALLAGSFVGALLTGILRVLAVLIAGGFVAGLLRTRIFAVVGLIAGVVLLSAVLLIGRLLAGVLVVRAVLRVGALLFVAVLGGAVLVSVIFGAAILAGTIRSRVVTLIAAAVLVVLVLLAVVVVLIVVLVAVLLTVVGDLFQDIRIGAVGWHRVDRCARVRRRKNFAAFAFCRPVAIADCLTPSAVHRIEKDRPLVGRRLSICRHLAGLTCPGFCHSPRTSRNHYRPGSCRHCRRRFGCRWHRRPSSCCCRIADCFGSDCRFLFWLSSPAVVLVGILLVLRALLARRIIRCGVVRIARRIAAGSFRRWILLPFCGFLDLSALDDPPPLLGRDCESPRLAAALWFFWLPPPCCCCF